MSDRVDIGAGSGAEFGADSDQWPYVSVVMPVRNEAADLEQAVLAILDQEYHGDLDVWLAVGPSDDATGDIAHRLAERHPVVHIVPNPSGRTPAALNAAIDASAGDVVVRVDGHSRLRPGYVARAVTTLLRTGAVNVGGIQSAVGTTDFERAVAIAMTSWIGTGGARFHIGGEEGPVDTVYLGVFRRTALEAVGGFDEHLVRNQDYELNIRLRGAGGTVWFDPLLSTEYRPRGTWRGLARQYFEYGWWKAEVAREHPSSLRPRQVAPVVITLAVTAGVVRRRGIVGRIPIAYLSATTAMALWATRPNARIAPRLAAVLPTMHLAWGAGFASSVIARRVRRG